MILAHVHGAHERRRWIRLPRLTLHLRRGRHDDPGHAEEAEHDAAWQREVVAPGPPAEFAPVAEPVTEDPPLDPLPAPIVDRAPRVAARAWVPVTFTQPEPVTAVDLPAIPGRGDLAGHVAVILARPARSQLGQFVDSVLAPASPWSDATGSFAAVVL